MTEDEIDQLLDLLFKLEQQTKNDHLLEAIHKIAAIIEAAPLRRQF